METPTFDLMLSMPFIPSYEWLCLYFKARKVTIEGQEQFQKQTHRNRTYILGANNIEALSIPLSKTEKTKHIQSVALPTNQTWKTKHLRAIETAYRSAIYFEHYWEPLKAIYLSNYETLWTLNYDLLTFCLTQLGRNDKIRITRQYNPIHPNNIDMRQGLNKALQAHSRGLVHLKPYEQVFGNEFVQNMNALDLLFNLGPQAYYWINSCELNPHVEPF